jgi:peroxiredoxin
LLTAFEAGVLALWIALVATLLLAARVVRALNAQGRTLASVLPLGLGVGDPAPDFAARTVDGREVARRAPEGGDTVLAFLSARCRTCRGQAPALRRVAAGARARGVHVVAVIDGTAETAAPLLEALDGAVPAVLAPAGKSRIVADYRVGEFPRYFIVDDGGIVKAVGAAPQAVAAAAR